MQREVPGDPGAGTSSYWVMPSNTATKISTIFRDRVITELIYLLISAAMVSMMFRRLIWVHFFYHFLAIRLYHEFLSQLIHFIFEKKAMCIIMLTTILCLWTTKSKTFYKLRPRSQCNGILTMQREQTLLNSKACYWKVTSKPVISE